MLRGLSSVPCVAERPVTFCTIESKPRRDGPRAFVAVGADADADDAGPELGHSLGREAARGERAGPIALGEDVGLAHQAVQGLDAGRLAQVDPGAALAVSGVHQDFGLVGQVRRRDVQHLGAVLRQHAAAGRAGQHAREIEHAHAAQRTIASSGSGRGGASPILTMSISGNLATAMPCGWAFHSSRLRTRPPTQSPVGDRLPRWRARPTWRRLRPAPRVSPPWRPRCAARRRDDADGWCAGT